MPTFNRLAMSNKSNRDIGFFIVFLLVLSLGKDFYGAYKKQRAEQNLQEQLNKLQLQYAPAERDTIRDSVKVVTQKGARSTFDEKPDNQPAFRRARLCRENRRAKKRSAATFAEVKIARRDRHR